MAAKKEEAPKQDRSTVMITVPEDPQSQSNVMFVSVNGKCYKLMRGRTTRVPRAVAEVIRESEEASKAAREKARILVQEAAQKAKATGLL